MSSNRWFTLIFGRMFAGRCAAFVAALLSALVVTPGARADTEASASTAEGRASAPDAARLRLDGLVLLHVGDGFGAGGQIHWGRVGLRASMAYYPAFFNVDNDGGGDRTFELVHSAQLNLDMLLLATKSGLGASLGYRYNTLLGHGAAVAFQGMFELWQQRFSFSFPVMYYPEGTDRVRQELGLSSEYRINYPFGGGMQFGAGVAWLF
jgi:hypothetical protein